MSLKSLDEVEWKLQEEQLHLYFQSHVLKKISKCHNFFQFLAGHQKVEELFPYD